MIRSPSAWGFAISLVWLSYLGVLMPYLEITDGSGNLTTLAPMVVGAAMLYPDSLEDQYRYFAWKRLDLARFTGKPHLLDEVDIKAISCGPGRGEFYRKGILEAEYGGQVTGEMLWFLLRAHKHSPQHASVHKAVFLTSKDLKRGVKRQTGRNVPASRTEIRKAWSRFKKASHLWAVWRLSDAPNLTEVWETGFFGPPEEDLLVSLSLAEEFRIMAESIIPRSRQEPLIDPQEVWQAPPDLHPYLSSDNIDWSLATLADWELELLKDYQAPSPY